MKRTRRVAAVAVLVASGIPLSAGSTAAGAANDPGTLGSFGPVFTEPKGHECKKAADTKSKRCKPSAVTSIALNNGKVAYWDGLEGMNKVGLNVVAEFGNVAMSDQARVLDPQRRTWAVPKPDDSGVNPGGNDKNAEYLPLVPHDNENKKNDGNLFCANVVHLQDGKVLITGGTAYYSEPSVPGTGYGVVELEGIHNTRIFDPRKNTFSSSGDMSNGRWYPSTVTLGSGKVLVVGGVRKLIKPVYPSAPEKSFTNVHETETYNPAKGKWKRNPASANKSLPLMPRVHMLPDGKVYFDAAGQVFNPLGYSYDEATWNMTSAYDPKRQTWTDLGVPEIGGLPLGFRGSGFSVMLPLKPGNDGKYTRAQFLSGGGVIGVTPGTYVGTDTATVNTVDTANGDKFTSESTGAMNAPRWYAAGVVLPDGKVLTANGASADEVVAPGTGFPVKTMEIWDPETGKWTETGSQTRDRTYHNSAILLQDGRVLLGGHGPIGTGYAKQLDEPHDMLGMSRPTNDPSFQIYSPPYLHWGKRPAITEAPSQVPAGRTLTISGSSPTKVSSVRLIRNAAQTHLVDGDQRTVDLRIVKRSAGKLTLALPDGNVLPAGPYMLFMNRHSAKGEIPSVAKQVTITPAASKPKDSGPARGSAPVPLPEIPDAPGAGDAPSVPDAPTPTPGEGPAPDPDEGPIGTLPSSIGLGAVLVPLWFLRKWRRGGSRT